MFHSWRNNSKQHRRDEPCVLMPNETAVLEADDGVTLKSLGKTSVGWPLITNSRELSFRRLESKSSRLCSKNLKEGREREG